MYQQIPKKFKLRSTCKTQDSTCINTETQIAECIIKFNRNQGKQLGLQIQKLKNFGYGLVATRFIDPKTDCGQYEGERLSKRQFSERYPFHNAQYVIDIPEELRRGHKDVYLDAQDVQKSNHVRFANQPGEKEQPNCILTSEELKLQTTELIFPGQQLLWDYRWKSQQRTNSENERISKLYHQKYQAELANNPSAQELNDNPNISKLLGRYSHIQ